MPAMEAQAPQVAKDADGGLSKEMQGLLATLRDAGLPEANLSSISAAVRMLEQPLEARPAWTSAPGRGLFFVFEGLDRSGKSTQSKMLRQHLSEQGRETRWRCFPDRSTAVGEVIDRYLRKELELPDEAVHLLFSANRWEAAEGLCRDLREGRSVVCDRYAFSGVAYSASKGLDLDWCKAPDIGLPLPDAVFYMHVDETVGASRAGFGDERYENAKMQARVRVMFRSEGIRSGVNWRDVDGARGIEEIHAEICTAAGGLYTQDSESSVRPIPRLWTE